MGFEEVGMDLVESAGRNGGFQSHCLRMKDP